MRPCGRRVHPVSLDSLGFTLVVVVFIYGRWVESCARWGSSLVAGFIGVRPRGRRVHPGSLGSLWCALGLIGLIWSCWVHWGAPWW